MGLKLLELSTTSSWQLRMLLGTEGNFPSFETTET